MNRTIAIGTRRRAMAGLLLLLLTVFAFGLRAHWLDHQSLWGDEVGTVYQASQPTVPALLRSASAEGVHPPLPYLWVHFWMGLVGRSEFALRFVSVMAGTLAVPLLYALGRRMAGEPTGLIAAALLAVSPFHVYYGQELRAYAQLTLWAILSCLLLLRALAARPGSPARVWHWVAYGLANSLLLYTHYFGAFVIAGQVMYGAIGLAVSPWRRGWIDATGRGASSPAVLDSNRGEFGECATRAVLPWALSGVLMGVTLVPWIWLTWQRTSTVIEVTDRFRVGLAQVAARVLSVFSLGATWQFSETLTGLSPRLIPFAVLLLLGLLSLRRSRTWFLVCWLLAPILGATWVTFAGHRDWTRFYIAASPAFYLLIAQGASDLIGTAKRFSPARRQSLAGWVAGLVVLIPLFSFQWPSTLNYYADPSYARPDYRGVVNRILSTPDSVLVQDGGRSSWALDYYYTDRSSYRAVPPDCASASEAAMAEQLEQAVIGSPEIWLLRIMPVECDPTAFVPLWLAEHAFPAEEFWIENHLFAHYFNPARMVAGGEDAGRLGDQIELEEWAVDQSRVRPGDELNVALRWVSSGELAGDYRVFVFLANPSEQVAAIRDAVPTMWIRPTTTWQPGETVVDHHGLWVAPNAIPGDYWLGVGMYDSATGERLSVTAGEAWLNGTAIRLTSITIVGE